MASMEGDDLDNLIADSLGGVQSALEAERKAVPAATPADTAARNNAGEAVRELQQRPARSSADPSQEPPNQEFFSSLVKTFQDPSFQKAMSDALSGAEPPSDAARGAAGAAEATKPIGEAAQAGTSSAVGSASAAGSGTSEVNNEVAAEEFLQNFMKSFDSAVGSDGNFEKSLTSLMTSMLSNDLICEPLKQISDHLEPWLKSQKGLPAAERSRYEAQLRMYRQILSVYKSSPDPLPERAREEVQRLLAELHNLGQPPEEVMRQIAPKEAEEGTESFEDFMKTMGLDSNLGAAEQDLLKKLAEDPEELTKVMKDMADGLPDQACKQQ